jgi:hypothetical protein
MIMQTEPITDGFKWTDELVLLALDLAHHNGYHKFGQRCVEVFDEVKEQAMRSGYKYPQWILDHIQSKQQSVPNKDYEIVAFKDFKNHYEYYTKNEHGEWSNAVSSKKYTQWELIHNGYAIHSVRRISDNSVFSVGDEVYFNQYNDRSKIEKFLHDDSSTTRNGMYATMTDGKYLSNLSSLRKYNKPLFRTEDNKPIYEGDYYFPVNKNFFQCGRCNGLGWYQPDSGEKYFSTKEAAEDYINCNKPCLSYNDISNYYDSVVNRFAPPFKEGLKELVKQKINK